ncbi:MAG TPA: RDD family protein [Candidatus Pacebacteria bacterium]|nr:RDD family protein [Candidatus Paceibacterota bacterium]
MAEEKKEEKIVEKQPVQNVQPRPNTTQAQQAQQKPSNISQLPTRYSGFWVRGAAYIIDSFVLGIITFVIVIPLNFVIGFASVMGDSVFMSLMGQVIATIIGLAVGWGYYIFMTHKFQATLGKMAVGAKVIDESGQNLSLGKIVLRETIGKLVSGFLFGIGYLMAAFTSKKQGLHDMMSHSVVVYKDAQKGANNVVVAIVYILYGLMMAIFMVVVMFFVIVVGAAIANSGNSFSLESFIDGISSEMNDDEYFDETEYFNDMKYFDEIPFDIEELEQLEEMISENL